MNDDRLEEILNSIGAEEIPAEVRGIAQDASNNFNKFLRQPSQPAKPSLLELIMRSRTTKIAAAAVIVIAVLAGLPFLPKNTASVTLAGVAEKLGQVKAIMYRMKMHVTGSMVPGTPQVSSDMESTIIISDDFGMKMEMDTTMEMETEPNTGKKTTQQMYVVPDSKLIVMIMPEQKKFTRMEFSDDLLARMKKQNNDPREMIKQMMGAKYTDLGKSEINGIEVEGFKTTDPAIYGGTMGDVKVTLWVDAATWLPVLIEMDMTINEKMRITGTIYDYQWNVPVDKSIFEPVIPTDYEAFPKEGMKMPEMTEEAAIEGLKIFADLCGHYPKQANMMDVMQEITAVMVEQAPKEKPGDMTETERVTKFMETMRPVQSFALLYMTLVQDKKEPVYHGESVGPEDVGAVLMRWKTAENEYRVIFGDLSARTVTGEQLAELEKQPLK
jgi:outer membrane lipoprotein-sorting protein